MLNHYIEHICLKKPYCYISLLFFLVNNIKYNKTLYSLTIYRRTKVLYVRFCCSFQYPVFIKLRGYDINAKVAVSFKNKNNFIRKSQVLLVKYFINDFQRASICFPKIQDLKYYFKSWTFSHNVKYFSDLRFYRKFVSTIITYIE